MRFRHIERTLAAATAAAMILFVQTPIVKGIQRTEPLPVASAMLSTDKHAAIAPLLRRQKTVVPKNSLKVDVLRYTLYPQTSAGYSVILESYVTTLSKRNVTVGVGFDYNTQHTYSEDDNPRVYRMSAIISGPFGINYSETDKLLPDPSGFRVKEELQLVGKSVIYSIQYLKNNDVYLTRTIRRNINGLGVGSSFRRPSLDIVNTNNLWGITNISLINLPLRSGLR